MKWLLNICLLLAVSPGAFAQPQVRDLSVEQANQRWAWVLQNHVSETGYVNFSALQASPAQLNAFVEWIAAVDPGNRADLFPTRESVLAYYLNAYNALAMHQVLEQEVPDALSGLKRGKFFRRAEMTIGGRLTNLEDFENNVLRKLGDPRVQWALSYMTESSPRLSNEPYVASQVDEQLDHDALRFFADPRNVRVDREEKRVYLPAAMEDKSNDFLAVAPSLIAYVNRYRAPNAQLPEAFDVRFMDYDWTVIQQR